MSQTKAELIDAKGDANFDSGTLYVDASTDRVGIGTTSPGAALHVVTSGAGAIRHADGTRAVEMGSTGTVSYIGSITAGQDLALYAANGEKARIDSSGRLLVGTSSNRAGGLFQIETSASDASRIHTVTNNSNNAISPVWKFIKSRGTTSGASTLVQSGDDLGFITFAGTDGTNTVDGAYIGAQVDAAVTASGNEMPTRLVFSTTADGASSPTERMRIDSNGNLLVGTTTSWGSNNDFRQTIETTKHCLGLKSSGNGFVNLACWNTLTTGNNTFAEFYTEGGSGTFRGAITYNRGGGVVAYNTTSDYRAKTLVGIIENPGETIDALKVYRGLMNGATVERPMLVAHEAQEVAPYCVTGEKDAVDDEGNPIYQQMDHQVLVPLLIAEIQQLRARVAALESA